MIFLWDTDTQNDFCFVKGKLYVPGAAEVRFNQSQLVIKALLNPNVMHVASADDHEFCDEEISFEPDFQTKFPPHCMRATWGSEKFSGTKQADPTVFGETAYTKNQVGWYTQNSKEILLLKKNFDVFTNPNTSTVLDIYKPEKIVLFGVAIDVCVNAAALGLLERGYDVSFVLDASAGLVPEKVDQCVSDWRSKGITVVTTEEALEVVSRSMV